MSKTWRCFHCDEVFRDRRSAWEHFGEEYSCASDVPACVDPLRTDEKARLKALREAQEHAINMQREFEAADDKLAELDNIYRELKRYFGEDCNSVWLAGDRYKSALNLIEALQEKVPV